MTNFIWIHSYHQIRSLTIWKSQIVLKFVFDVQIQSFEADISVPQLTSKEGGPETYRGVFIRAPAVLDVGPDVEVLADYPVPSNKVLYSSSTVQIQEVCLILHQCSWKDYLFVSTWMNPFLLVSFFWDKSGRCSSWNKSHCCCEARKLVSNCFSSRVNCRHTMVISSFFSRSFDFSNGSDLHALDCTLSGSLFQAQLLH